MRLVRAFSIISFTTLLVAGGVCYFFQQSAKTAAHSSHRRLKWRWGGAARQVALT
jgi:hypothetical protein